MRYRKSRARKRFEVAAADVLRVIRAAHTGKPGSPDVRAYVLCSAMVLTSAAIESYLEDVLTVCCTALCSSGSTASILPTGLRAHIASSPQITDAYKRYIASGDEEQFHSSIVNLFDSAAAVLSSTAPIPTFTASDLYGAKRYPSVKNIQNMFRRLGIPRIFSRLNGRIHAFAEQKMQSFNDVRNGLAHQGAVTGLSTDDIRTQIKTMVRLISAMDAEIHATYPSLWNVRTWAV